MINLSKKTLSSSEIDFGSTVVTGQKGAIRRAGTIVRSPMEGRKDRDKDKDKDRQGDEEYRAPEVC